MRTFLLSWIAGCLLVFGTISCLHSQNWKPSKVTQDHEWFAGKWIPVNEVVTTDSLQAKLNFNWPIFNHAGAGMYFIPGYARLYQTFLRMPLGKMDYPVMIAEGGLTYFPKEKVFRIGPKECLLGDAQRGNVVTYNPESQQLSAKGIFDLPVNMGKKGPRMETAGSWTQTGGPIQIETNLVTALYLPQLNEKAWDRLTSTFLLVSSLNEPVDLEAPENFIPLAELIDKDQKDHARSNELRTSIAEAVMPSDVELPSKWNPDLVLSGVNWKYNNDHQALWANDNIGVVSLGDKVVNRKISMKMEYRYGELFEDGTLATDTLSLFMEGDDLSWVYFRYFDDQMEVASSDEEDKKSKKGTSFNHHAKRPKFAYRETSQVVTEKDKNEFLHRFVSRYIWGE